MSKRNPIARDLGTDKYRQRVKEVKRKKIINDLRQRELDEEMEKYIHDRQDD